MQTAVEDFVELVLDVMNRLHEVLGEEDYNALLQLLYHVDLHFDQLIFEDNITAEEIELIHEAAQSVSMMMKLRTSENEHLM